MKSSWLVFMATQRDSTDNRVASLWSAFTLTIMSSVASWWLHCYSLYTCTRKSCYCYQLGQLGHLLISVPYTVDLSASWWLGLVAKFYQDITPQFNGQVDCCNLDIYHVKVCDQPRHASDVLSMAYADFFTRICNAALFLSLSWSNSYGYNIEILIHMMRDWGIPNVFSLSPVL